MGIYGKRRRQLAAMVLATTLGLSACGGSSSDESSASEGTVASAEGEATSSGDSTEAIKKAKNCDQLMEAATPLFTDLFQGLVDDMQKMSVEDLGKLSEDVEGSEFMQTWLKSVETRGSAVDEAANKLNCSEDDAQQAFCDAVKGVKGDNPMAMAMIEGMATQCA